MSRSAWMAAWPLQMVEQLSLAELAIVGAVLLVLLCGMVWHLSTFSAWINATLQMAQERGVEGLVSPAARAPAPGSQRCLSARRGRWTT